MKLLFVLLLSFSLLLSFAACGAANPPVETSSERATDETSQSIAPAPSESGSLSAQPSSPAPVPGVSSEEETQPVKIRLTVNGETAIVELFDNDAAADFVSMLPLTLTFADYNGIEKIAALPRELHTGSAPASCDPDVGSFAYYAPWGNLSVFYEDFRESESLVPLGSFTSGIDIFAGMSGEFVVTLEREET